jgi:SDR family mycofactocin-dependent oxidoreductase
MGRLDGRVALITGGARGQGRAIAAKFASEGADIVIADICGQIPSVKYEMSNKGDLQATAELIESADRRCLAEQADVRDLSQIKAVADKAMEEFGHIDILAANAGMCHFAPFWEITEEEYDDVMDVCLKGVWNSVLAVAPYMKEQMDGSIVLTSSTSGVEAAPDIAHYNAAKHGVLGLMKSFAYELGPFNVRVNAIMPGPIATKMGDNAVCREWMFGRKDATTEDYIDATRNWHLLRGRPALAPVDIANAYIWFASDEAKNVTGVVIPVDAGHLVLPGMNPNPIVDDELGTFDYDATALS